MINISIIIPIFNSEKSIRKCLDSIPFNSELIIEVILIDDGSNDNSLLICKEYEQKSNKVKVYHQENKGVSEARNFGIQQSTSDWIMFVDSDDYLISDSLSNIMNSLDKLQDSTYYILSNLNTKISVIDNNINRVIVSILNWTNNCDYNGIGMLASVCCHLYSKKIINKYNIQFDKDLFMGEDMLFNIEYLLHTSNVEIINGNFYIYNDNQESISKKFNIDLPKYDELFHNKLIDLLKENNFTELSEIAIVRSPLGGILTCCNSYFFRYPEISINDSAKELNEFVSNELYANALNNMKQVKQYFSIKQYVLLLLIKYKMYRLAYILKNILK